MLITPIGKSKTYQLYHSFSFRITTNTNTPNISTHKSWHNTWKYSHTNQQKHLSANVHGNQQIIYDINTQRIELDKGMLIANTLKCKLNSQQSTNASWLVTTIKVTLKIPIQKFENPILSFKRTHEASVRNSKILTESKGDLSAAIAAHKDIPVNYGSEFRNTTALAQLFLHHEGKKRLSL